MIRSFYRLIARLGYPRFCPHGLNKGWLCPTCEGSELPGARANYTITERP